MWGPRLSPEWSGSSSEGDRAGSVGLGRPRDGRRSQTAGSEVGAAGDNLDPAVSPKHRRFTSAHG